MNWQNPIKTVTLCFYETGHIKDHYATAEDAVALDRLIAFLLDARAVIVGLENFSATEVDVLRRAKRPDGRPLFATNQCFQGHGAAGRCARLCPLKFEPGKVA